ncbi:MAG: NUDIX domain-containing protein [Anaerolineae bacterium]|nr:NUDIX domain-containing protein [Anaerolineae bacterium]
MDPVDQGVISSQYTVIPRNLIFITHQDSILLLKGAPDKRLWAHKYNGIGGHIKPGETPLQSAHRELLEETGLVVEHLDLRALIHIRMPKSPGIMLFVFVGSAENTEVLCSPEGKPEWILKSTYQQLELVEDLYKLLPLILEPGPLIYGSYILENTGLAMVFSSGPQQQPDQEVNDV